MIDMAPFDYTPTAYESTSVPTGGSTATAQGRITITSSTGGHTRKWTYFLPHVTATSLVYSPPEDRPAPPEYLMLARGGGGHGGAHGGSHGGRSYGYSYRGYRYGYRGYRYGYGHGGAKKDRRNWGRKDRIHSYKHS